MDRESELQIKAELNKRGAVLDKEGDLWIFKFWGTETCGSPVLCKKSRHPSFESAVNAANNYIAKIGA